jgi:hypothetical protein
MKFFVPHTNDVQAQEQLHRLVRGNVESQVRKVAARRIRRAEYQEHGIQVAEVGRLEPIHGDEVFAIFMTAEGDAILICTPSFGMFNDQPITIPMVQVVSLEDFD